jgi:hypothetical protein
MTLDDPARLMVLKEILGETELFAGEDGAVYAQFPRDGELVAYGTHWPEFMTWLKAEATERLNSIPSAKLIKQAIAEVEYKARKEFSYPIAPRIYADERSAVVHLGDGKMLDIRASGARLNEDAGVVFPTPFNMEPLPKLEDGAALEVLPEILDLSDDQCRLVLIWLMALFQPNGR